MNLTITVPDGSSNHGNPNLLCTPPSWFDYILFYFSNYFAHAATVISTPGQGSEETFLAILAALLFPASGLTCALEAIRRCSRTESDPIKRAVRAGALCMVVRAKPSTEIYPQSLEAGVQQTNTEQHDPSNPVEPKNTDQSVTTDIIVDTSTPGSETAEQRGRQWWNPVYPRLLPGDAVIHGQYHLPDSYRLAFVPLDAAVELESPEGASHKALSSSYNFPKILVSFVQATWAIITLYRARGDQIQQYGYAAFGLTVAPYALMSVMNIIGTFLNPEYPALFLVQTPLMIEAEFESEGGFFAAHIHFKAAEDRPGTNHSSNNHNKATEIKSLTITIGSILVGSIPLAIIGGLSGFRAQNSTSLQRGFTMSWLVLGIWHGPPIIRMMLMNTDSVTDSEVESRAVRVIGPICVYLVYGVAAIGGMVVVGQMIRDFGVCTLLT